jgi:hypothetical protein
VQPNNIKESILFRRDQHYASLGTDEGERAVKVHALMLLSDWGGGVWLLSLSPFSYKIHHGLGLDYHLGHIGYAEPHRLKYPFGDPSRGKMVPENFSEPKWGHHMDQVTLEIV